MKNKIKVLFICLGNICRSPAAQGAFESLVQKEDKINLFEIDSCGTSGYHDGELPDPRTRKAALKRGIHLTHRSRKLNLNDLDYFDYLLVMDDNNFREVISLISDEPTRKKVMKFGSFRTDNGISIVPDPYYGNERDFESVQDLVENCSVGFLKFLGV
ncbi:low molecular weight protein-tyrosine-phosphatase [Leptospira biflexa]|uniref:low molecular weight protein-tyrosine-phosphatase n=1 Tax=Leptospira biflexa TaxID=172 RepID=UPI001082E1EF|nr:low molecular weight protein-tyrosine-phosphatase [Leptospira biflexa]TGM32046.1 low molecular weight phosphotyrosine protein phosphatase [Leptospira biflexa]TGM42024.1 low molecular weight phosphotyrosine protein phosphatase [Leptospira biflexa]